MKFSSRLQRFFQGRYGYDALSKALLITALILSLLVLVFRLEVLAPLPLILLLFVFYRAYSKNYAARRGENDRYLQLARKTKNFFKLQKKQIP